VTYYLIEHPPAQRQFRDRGTTPSGVIVVHTAESTPDWVGPDAGAEGVARFIQGRGDFGSYHTLCDSDSILPLVPPWMQAYGDRTGSNPHAWHVSAATQAAKWGQAPKEWRIETVKNMAAAAARYARWLKRQHGIVIPAHRISRAESEQRKPGFISHAERDPSRRSDPGQGFPWKLFLDTFADLMDPAKPTPNITDALQADTAEERRAALRRVLRRSDDEKAQLAAQRWLQGITAGERAKEKRARARETLRGLEVKP
jgi:hypothetical protein